MYPSRLITILPELRDAVHVIQYPRLDYILYSSRPEFYTDYYIVLHISPLGVVTYIRDPQIIKDVYHGINLRAAIKLVYANYLRVSISGYMIKYAILELHDERYCAYIERRWIWDTVHNFSATGIITIFSESRDALVNYFTLHYLHAFLPRTRMPKKNATNSAGKDKNESNATAT